jgi:hypothetical protein
MGAPRMTRCEALAAESGMDKAAEWVALARAAGLEARAEGPVVRIITEERALADSSPGGKAVDERKARIDRLRTFAELATELVMELEQGIGQRKRYRPRKSQRPTERRASPQSKKPVAKGKREPRPKARKKALPPKGIAKKKREPRANVADRPRGLKAVAKGQRNASGERRGPRSRA